MTVRSPHVALFHLLSCSRCVQEVELARDEARRMSELADSEARRCLALEREMVESGGQLAQQASDDNHR